MRISLNWLKEYINFSYSPEDLAQRLTMVGLEVENIEYLGKKYANFVVGEVLEVSKHPNADKLSVCKVNSGKEILQIVCGAPNVAPRQKVALGLIGAEVPRNQHDPNGKPFKLTQVKIRGVESFGMICSAYELDLGDDSNGILVLDQNARVGQELSRYFGLDDIVYEVGITPNRPDAMNHIGIAREVAALIGKSLRMPSLKIKESKKKASDFASIKIDLKSLCPRYTAKVILGVHVGPSPKWMQERLSAVGLRPVNNIVDVTNYVLMECGHPLHAFDYDKLNGHSVIVKTANSGDQFITLDHKKRTLADDTLMICDAKGYLAIAGVMGGLNSEISDTTVNVLLESAYFNPQSIRRTSKRFGLSTDASQRFERGADSNITEWAVNRTAILIQQLAGGEILKGVLDAYPKKIQPKKVSLRIHKANELLGTSLTEKNILSYLKKINILPISSSKQKKSTGIQFSIPTYRPDIEREVDLIEEVARVHGYDNIKTLTNTHYTFTDNAPQIEFVEILREWLLGSGYNEVISNSMQDETTASIVLDNIVKIANPISREMSSLRTSLVPGILQIIRDNIFHGSRDLRLYEIGKIYLKNPVVNTARSVDDFKEYDRLLLAFTGANNPLNWSEKQRAVDLYDVKGELQTLMKKISLDKIKFIPYPNTKALTPNGLAIEINGVEAGLLGNVSSELLKRFEIEQDVFVAELSIEALNKFKANGRKYQSLSKFPSVLRDIAFIVDKTVPVESLATEIQKTGSSLLTKVELFDIYTGTQLDAKKKSCAFALEFKSEERTLSQEEVDQFMQKIIHQISTKFEAVIRS